MTADAGTLSQATSNRDWRLWFGIASTLSWLWLGLMYVGIVVGWGQFIYQPAEALGGFLEGAFAPLAFLWLVIGFFLQQRELRQNNLAILAQYAEMRRTAENAEIQSRAISANELHQRQETFLLVADRVNRQLGSVIGMLWMSSQSEDSGADAVISELWSQVGSGDPDVFARQFMGLYFRNRSDPDFTYALFFGTEIRTRHSETIIRTFERLLAAARSCDPDGMIYDAVRGGAQGRLYEMIVAERDSRA